MSKIIFACPHPDDIEIFCGGAFLEHAKEDRVTIILMTKGGKGSRNPFKSEQKLEEIRGLEIQNRLALIKNAKLIFADFKDGNITVNDESIIKIHLLIKAQMPDIIYVPEYTLNWTSYQHQDHQKTGEIFIKAAKKLKYPIKIRCYHSLRPNFFYKISAYNYYANSKATKFYKSQKYTVWKLTRKYNKMRQDWGQRIGSQYAEGFREFSI